MSKHAYTPSYARTPPKFSRPPSPEDPQAFHYSTTLRRASLDGDLPSIGSSFGSIAKVVSHAYPSHSHSHHGPSHTSIPMSMSGSPLPTRTRNTPCASSARKTADAIIAELSTDSSRGLTSTQVPSLTEIHGRNEFEVKGKEPTWVKFGKQFWENPLILLLLASAVVSAAFGNRDDAISIAVAVTIVVSVGFIQEQRSEASLEALNKLVPHYCHLTREGIQRTCLANILVPGDLVTITTGDRIPADIRLIHTAQLEVDESNLTGESHPAKKDSEPIELPMETQLHISEMKNIGFMGTLVKNGWGRGIVVGTGTNTEMGIVFEMMQDVEEKKTPLQISMDDLAKRLSLISFGVIGVICLIGIWQKRHWLEMFTIGVSLAVAAIPEGLPIVVTVTLALGVLRMSKRKAIVKKLPSVETLGSVSVICTDKTGTLTTNVMTVTQAYTVDSDVFQLRSINGGNGMTEAMQALFLTGNLCNKAYYGQEGTMVGQATEVALMNVLKVVGMNDVRTAFAKSSEIPFSSETKWQSVTGSFTSYNSHPPSTETTYMTGMIEAVLSTCTTYLRSESAVTPLDEKIRTLITVRAKEVASSGLRVVAMASGNDPNALTFIGFQAMLDPPRLGVQKAIQSLSNAGVHVVMITGDSEQTAVAIAKQLNLRMNPGAATQCITGKEIENMSPRQLSERVGGVSVFARVTPRHKMAIIEAFQSRGLITAMVGDGVNDAPSLKMADIGISMGKAGTDVAKEAADVILVDDNFATILPAVEEGKSIFYNIQNFLVFQLSTAVAALSLITLSTMLELPTPLNAMQILFINILMDGPPSQSLGVDPVNRDVMKRPPRPKNAPVLTPRLMYRILFSASMIIFGVLFIYAKMLSDGKVGARDQTMTFTSFVFLDLVSALQNRGLSCGITQNRMLIYTVSISFMVQLLLIYFPPLQAVFQTEALGRRDLTVLLGLAGGSFGFHQARRWWERGLEEG
ncbi:calcium-transporting P, partial [Atractiella rhizophila]